MDVTEATALAQRYLDDQLIPPEGMRYAIVTESIKEVADGWYVPWQTDRYLETRDINHSVVGNWPIFVTKLGEVLGPRRPQ